MYELQNAGLSRFSKGDGSGVEDRRIEAAVLPVPGMYPVPARSESVYVNASERCPV